MKTPDPQPSPDNVAVVPGATHLLEEPGALEGVAELARHWFVEHLGSAPSGGQDRRRAIP